MTLIKKSQQNLDNAGAFITANKAAPQISQYKLKSKKNKFDNSIGLST